MPARDDHHVYRTTAPEMLHQILRQFDTVHAENHTSQQVGEQAPFGPRHGGAGDLHDMGPDPRHSAVERQAP